MYFEIEMLKNQEYAKVAHTIGLRMQEAEIMQKFTRIQFFEMKNL